MKNYDATEQSYKNGYKKGYEDGKRDAVKHGRWIPTESMVLTSRCSVCRCWVTKHAITNPNYSYCPYCGADMRGEENGSV